MFDAYTISSREADIAYMEASDLFALSIDEGFITSFTEAGEGEKKSKSGSKIVETVKNLAEKILKFFQDFIDSAKAKLLGKKIKENPKALENKKAEVLDLKKIMLFRKSYKKKIESAKTVEEVDVIVSEYEKKNKSVAIGGALAVLAVPLSVLAGQIATGKLKEAGDKMVKDLQDECQSKFIKYSHDSFELVNNKGTSENATNYVDSKKNLEDAQSERSKKTKYDKDGKLVAKKGYALQKLISDDMKSVKDYFTSAVSAVSNGLKESVQKSKDKKAGQLAGKEARKEAVKNGYVLNKDGSVNLEATTNAQPIGDSVEDIAFGDDFTSFEEAFDDLTFFGDDLFEESGLSDVGKKVSNAIKVLIEKIKKLYEEIKSKMEVAKIKAILGTKAAKSNIKIRFAIKDKNITKTVGLYMKAYNNSIVEVKKIEKKFTSGKITVDEMNAELDREEAKFYTEVSRISSTNAASKVNPDEHEARAISEYLGNLTKYQDKVVYELNKSIQDELNRLQKEAEAAERAKLQKEAEEKKKLANAVAKRNKKILAVVISAIGLTGAVALFATQIKKKTSTGSTFNESVEEIEGMFAEAADAGSEDAFFGEEIFGNLDASGDTEF